MLVLRWLGLFLPIGALIVAVFYGFGRQDAQRELEERVGRERTAIALAGERLAQALEDSIDDVRLLRDTPAVRRYIESPDADARRPVEALFGAFVRGKLQYGSLRLIDSRGMEVIRVDRSPEGARAQPDAKLQDKHARDYVPETLALPLGRVRISRMDLNAEHGVIERPPNPTIRLSLRLQADAAHPDYILIANLRGAVLLKTLQDALVAGDGEHWLIDHEGYWLIHPEPAMNWGFQLDRSKQLGTLYPELATMLEQDRGTLRTSQALYVFRRLEGLSNLVHAGVIQAEPRLVLVGVIDASGLPLALPERLLWPLLAVLLIAALGCAVQVRTRAHADRAEQREHALRASQASADAETLWIRDRIYQLSLKIHAAGDPKAFGNAVLTEFAPTLGLAAASLYALRDGRAEPLAGFGLSPERSTREFALGEGLVGEAARTRNTRRMTPPPADYLDLLGGAGAGPAADLRVMPLWVHGRTVGVIELAFIDVLDARQEEFLHQTLPLIALNVDGFLHAPRRAG